MVLCMLTDAGSSNLWWFSICLSYYTESINNLKQMSHDRPCQEIKQDLHLVKGNPVHTRKQSGNILGNLTVDLNMKGDRST